MTDQVPAVEAKLWRADDLGAAFLRGRFADFAYAPHTHDTACLALITRGAIRIRMRGTSFVARAGDLYAIDAEEAHAGWPVDAAGWSQRTIYVDLASLPRLLSGEESRTGPLRGPIIREPQLGALFAAAHRSAERGVPGLSRDEAWLRFTRDLLARHVADGGVLDRAGDEARAVRLAREFLDARLDTRVRLAEVAAAAGLPPHRLYRAFERDTGLTPHGYQRQARIRQAVALIRRGGGLAEIAAATGFADQAHLTRSFRQRMGVTPGAYRAAWLGRA